MLTPWPSGPSRWPAAAAAGAAARAAAAGSPFRRTRCAPRRRCCRSRRGRRRRRSGAPTFIAAGPAGGSGGRRGLAPKRRKPQPTDALAARLGGERGPATTPFRSAWRRRPRSCVGRRGRPETGAAPCRVGPGCGVLRAALRGCRGWRLRRGSALTTGLPPPSGAAQSSPATPAPAATAGPRRRRAGAQRPAASAGTLLRAARSAPARRPGDPLERPLDDVGERSDHAPAARPRPAPRPPRRHRRSRAQRGAPAAVGSESSPG